MRLNIVFLLGLFLSALVVACKPNAPANAAASTAFANATDYNCGMKVQADWTDTCHYKAKVYGFCSESCKEAFQDNPESFLTEAANQ